MDVTVLNIGGVWQQTWKQCWIQEKTSESDKCVQMYFMGSYHFFNLFFIEEAKNENTTGESTDMIFYQNSILLLEH